MYISQTTAMEAEGGEAGKRGCVELGSLHGLEGEHQVGDMHSAFWGQDFSVDTISCLIDRDTDAQESFTSSCSPVIGKTWQWTFLNSLYIQGLQRI